MVQGTCIKCSNATCGANQDRVGLCSGTLQTGTADGGFQCVDRVRPTCSAKTNASNATGNPAVGRYVRISARDPILSLRQVQAFTATGTLIKPVQANLSTTGGAGTQARVCIDGKLSGTMCHSKAESNPHPHLIIDYGRTVEIAAIVVHNAVNCDACTMRIVGATISVERDQRGTGVAWSALFGTRRTRPLDVYRFNLQKREQI